MAEPLQKTGINQCMRDTTPVQHVPCAQHRQQADRKETDLKFSAVRPAGRRRRLLLALMVCAILATIGLGLGLSFGRPAASEQQESKVAGSGASICGLSGFAFGTDGQSCIDIDECEYNRCEHMCFNTNGSFTCSCNVGYTLNTDGYRCSDINECSTNDGGCAYSCINTAGSFTCTCQAGYVGDGVDCVPPTLTNQQASATTPLTTQQALLTTASPGTASETTVSTTSTTTAPTTATPDFFEKYSATDPTLWAQ